MAVRGMQSAVFVRTSLHKTPAIVTGVYKYYLVYHEQVDHRESKSEAEHKQSKGQASLDDTATLKEFRTLDCKLMLIIFRLVILFHDRTVEPAHTLDGASQTVRKIIAFRQLVWQRPVAVDRLSKNHDNSIHHTVQNSRDNPQTNCCSFVEYRPVHIPLHVKPGREDTTVPFLLLAKHQKTHDQNVDNRAHYNRNQSA